MPVGDGEFSTIYYRGQNSYYSPCKASIFRPDIDSFSLVRRYEFERILRKICIQNLANHYLHINNTHYFSVNFEGLCQHYEFPTSLLDISKDKDVAKFFAMCESKNGQYFPREGGCAYIYQIDLTKVRNEDRHKICLIGNQPLPRSKEQSGIAIKLGADEDFNQQEFISLEEIYFTKEEAIDIYNKFKKGDSLFTNDPIKDLIDEILNTISNESIFRFSQEYSKNFHTEFRKLLDRGLYISNDFYYNLLKSKEYKKLYLEVENYIKSNLLSFGVRGWCEHFIG